MLAYIWYENSKIVAMVCNSQHPVCTKSFEHEHELITFLHNFFVSDVEVSYRSWGSMCAHSLAERANVLLAKDV